MSKANDAPGPAGADGIPTQFFREIYEAGPPPWEVGRPQSEVKRLAEDGHLTGDVLDLGCGTGENSLLLAAAGARVVGIDPAPVAIEQAVDKARTRGIQGARFEVADALTLPYEAAFDVVLDTGVFHVFSDVDRTRYAASVAKVLRPGGRLFVVCFSEHEPGGGPRRVTQAELRATFAPPMFAVQSIRAGHYDAKEGQALAWVTDVLRSADV